MKKYIIILSVLMLISILFNDYITDLISEIKDEELEYCNYWREYYMNIGENMNKTFGGKVK